MITKEIEEFLDGFGLYAIWDEEDGIWKVFKYGGGLEMTMATLDRLQTWSMK